MRKRILVFVGFLILLGADSASAQFPPVPMPTPPIPVPIPPLTIRGSVQTMHGAPLPSDSRTTGLGLRTTAARFESRGTWIVLYEIDSASGYLMVAAGTACPSQYTRFVQACADQFSGAFQIFGDWEGRPLNPHNRHYLEVSVPGFFGRTIELPVGVSDIDLKTVNMEASPIEEIIVREQRMAGNRFKFSVHLKKITPASEPLRLNVYAVVWSPGQPYFPFTVSVPPFTALETAPVDFDVLLPDSVLPGLPASAIIVVADAEKQFLIYGQAFVSAQK